MANGEIVVENLSKQYGDLKAVDEVSFRVESGEIFGFLGPNGAGKSTTIFMLTTLALPSSGGATVGGYDIVKAAHQVRRIAGVALQEIGLDPLMTPIELLTIQGQLFGHRRSAARQRAGELLELVGLSEVIEKRTGKFSGGMRRRLDLALALVHEPQILFLDEPTTGLDPGSRRDVWAEIRRLNREKGITIFLTTQYMEEADHLAGRIAIIAKGKIAAEGEPAQMKADLGEESINVLFEDEHTAQRARQVLSDIEEVQADQKALRIYLPDAATAVSDIVTRLSQNDIHPARLTLAQPSLDDVFLEVTGGRFEVEAASSQS